VVPTKQVTVGLSGAVVVVRSRRVKGGSTVPFDVVIMQHSRRAVLVVRIGG
jgi:hypothetical protein